MPVKKNTKKCDIEDCDKVRYHTYRYCNMHQKRRRRNGDPNTVKYIVGDHEARFWSYVHKLGHCWIWTGPKSKTNRSNARYYGYLEIEGKNIKAHRYSYELAFGKIPESLAIDHKDEICTSTLCVRPEHLEAVTPQENTSRYFASKRKEAIKNSKAGLWT